MQAKKDWFQEWFDTPYYHLLYRDRNDSEAELFMLNLTQYLGLKKDDTLLDLPCGKGRHAIFLNSLGFDVTGADLSENSIDFAKQFENDSLRFEVHDMRHPFKTKFDVIFNLFTSFGYFDDDETDIAVLQNLKRGLKPNGILVIDFLNVDFVKEHLVPEENQHRSTIDFKINRSINEQFIIKDIRFSAENKEHHYTEYVRNINLEKFKDYADKADLKLKHTFGDYNLNPFDRTASPRLILILE